MTRVLSGPCVKCGENPGDSLTPEYTNIIVVDGGACKAFNFIKFQCPYCGYTWMKPCADAQPEERDE